MVQSATNLSTVVPFVLVKKNDTTDTGRYVAVYKSCSRYCASADKLPIGMQCLHKQAYGFLKIYSGDRRTSSRIFQDSQSSFAESAAVAMSQVCPRVCKNRGLPCSQYHYQIS